MCSCATLLLWSFQNPVCSFSVAPTPPTVRTLLAHDVQLRYQLCLHAITVQRCLGQSYNMELSSRAWLVYTERRV